MTCSAVTERLCLSPSNPRALLCLKKKISAKRAGRVYTVFTEVCCTGCTLAPDTAEGQAGEDKKKRGEGENS